MKKIGISVAAGIAAIGSTVAIVPATVSCSKPAPIKVIVDTDVGNDCDDIGALTVLGNAYKKGLVEPVAVTVCTRHTEASKQYDAIYATDIVLAKYGINCPIGLTSVDNFVPEQLTYATEMKTKFPSRLVGHESEIPEAHKLLRKVISENKGVKLITIGMLNNIKAFMDTNENGVTGKQLLEENVSEMILMGGRFNQEDPTKPDGPEFNIMKKLEASKAVINTTSVRKTFLGWEVGEVVKSGINFYNNPESPQYVAYNTYTGGKLRQSWDPLTVYIAIFGAWSYSNWGKVTVGGNDADTSYTTFEKDAEPRNCRIVNVHPNSAQLAMELEKWMTVE